MSGSPKLTVFRPTPWPGVQLEEPTVHGFQVSSPGAPWIHLDTWQEDQPDGATPWIFRVPENVCEQQVARADVSSFESMLKLCLELGGDLVPAYRERWRDIASPHRGLGVTDHPQLYADYVSNWSEALGYDEVHVDDLFPGKGEESYPIRIHVAEIAIRVWRLQCLLGALSGQLPLTESEQPEDFPASPSVANARLLTGYLSLFLGVFGPRVDFHESLSGDPSWDIVERRGWPATALEVAALQLYNVLARGGEWRACKKCNRPFSSQVDRAKYPMNQSHRRSDAQYCSKRCLNAEGRRKRRERDRLAKQSLAPETKSPGPKQATAGDRA